MIHKTAKIITELQPHQKAALLAALKGNKILAHSTGSGKTLTAIAIADALNQPTTVLTPASLVTNFQKELRKHKKGGPKINVLSLPTAVERNLPIAPGSTLIIDEIHSLRNADTKRNKYVKALADKAGRVYGLTATPIYNDPQDMAQLANVVSNGLAFTQGIKPYIRERKIPASWLDKLLYGMQDGVTYEIAHREALKKLLRNYVDVFEKDIEKPQRIDELVKVPMSEKQLRVYQYVTSKLPRDLREKIRKNMPPSKSEARTLNAFFSGARQTSNTTEAFDIEGEASPKLKAAAGNLVKMFAANPKTRALVYSNYLTSGIDSYGKLLEKAGIPYNKFNGSMSPKEKQKVVDQYNSGEVPVILGSGSASEGLDLKDTRLIQILEPHFNESKIDQVIGRGIRYKSHEDLPPEERNVTVQRYLSTIPKSNDTSIDEYLYNRAKDKQKIGLAIQKMLTEN